MSLKHQLKFMAYLRNGGRDRYRVQLGCSDCEKGNRRYNPGCSECETKRRVVMALREIPEAKQAEEELEREVEKTRKIRQEQDELLKQDLQPECNEELGDGFGI